MDSMNIIFQALTTMKGHEFTGIVQQTGSEVTLFHEGDEVVSIFSAVW